jgi:hypothetical protein
VNLLDGKRSLNINIYLRQFKMGHFEIVEHLSRGESEAIGAEKLRGLIKILPEKDEVGLNVLLMGSGGRHLYMEAPGNSLYQTPL